LYSDIAVARQIPVKIATPDVICLISSEHEISLNQANHIAATFLQNLKSAYGEAVLPKESSLTLHFEISVDEFGRITSSLPTFDQIQKAKAHGWNRFKLFKSSLR